VFSSSHISTRDITVQKKLKTVGGASGKAQSFLRMVQIVAVVC